MLSPSDTAIVFLLALLLFGPEQLPRIARQLGEAMRHVQTTTHTFMNEMERAARVDDAPPPVPPAPQMLPIEDVAHAARGSQADDAQPRPDDASQAPPANASG